MTKKMIRAVYFAYHILFPSRINTCRFEPTCSKYALEAYEKYGLQKGTVLTIKRLFSCHPFSNSPIIDPLI